MSDATWGQTGWHKEDKEDYPYEEFHCPRCGIRSDLYDCECDTDEDIYKE